MNCARIVRQASLPFGMQSSPRRRQSRGRAEGAKLTPGAVLRVSASESANVIVVADVAARLLMVGAHSAGVQDRDGAKSACETWTPVPQAHGIRADGNDAGKPLSWLAPHCLRMPSMVRRPHKRVFTVVQPRWMSSRAIGWPNRSRRLCRDFAVLCEIS